MADNLIFRAVVSAFPCPAWKNAAAYRKQHFADEGAKATIAAYEAAVASASAPNLKLLNETALRLLNIEETRRSSVIGRAQGLFFVMALLTLFATFGATLLTANVRPDKAELFWIVLISGLVLIQIILMTLNVIRAIGGLEQITLSSSDLARWSGLPNDGWTQAETIATMRSYREASLNNTWRFIHLDRAVLGLRNTIFGVSALIALLFAFDWLKAPDPCPGCFRPAMTQPQFEPA